MTKLLEVRAAIFVVLLGACAAESEPADQPPFGDQERIGAPSPDGKADGNLPVQVKARTSGYRSDDGANCYDTWYDVEVTYENTALPWGTNVELVSAMQGVEWSPDDVNNTYNYYYFDWNYEESSAAPAVGPWQWRAARQQVNFVGGGTFSALHFALKITYPDGTVRWDNGGSAWGYYEVTLLPAPCEMSWTPWVSTTPAWQPVIAHAVQKW